MSIPKEVLELISASGNNFHAKVAHWLVDNGWHITVSPYYLDQTVGKAREIDLIAEKILQTTNRFGRERGDVVIRLFIECKYIPSYSVFWFDNKNLHAAKELVCSGGIFTMENTYTDRHHYISNGDKVAKLFTTSTTRAVENDPFYKALNQVLNGMVYLRGQPVSIPGYLSSDPYIDAILEFPVVVCSSFDQIYSTDFYNQNTPEPISNNFQLEVQYAYVDRNQNQHDDYFLIDFVEYDKLKDFLDSLDVDAKAAAYLASDN